MDSELKSANHHTQQVLELKKHVAIIHSSNKLTLLQRKIANALLFNAYSELQAKEEHSINISRLCELIGYDSNDYKTIKKALVNLLSTVLEWNLVDGVRADSESIWNASSIIADASIDGSVCTYSYSNKMRKLLYHPTMYGRLDMLVQAKFQSSYGLALYENCNRFQDIGHTPWFSIDKFRKLMGVEEGKYKVFRDFKTRVLDKAVEEVNKYSSLRIRTQLRKENRKVTCVQFYIEKSVLISDQELLEEACEDNVLVHTLKSKFGFSQKQIRQVLTHYDEDYIRGKVNLIYTSKSYKNNKIKNLTRYLLSALRNNYQNLDEGSELKNLPSSFTDKYEVNKKLREEQEKMQQFIRYQDKNLVILFEQLTDTEKSTLLKRFVKFLGTSVYSDIYTRVGFDNVLIKDQLCVFLRKINHVLIDQLPTKDDWLEAQQGNTEII